MAISTGVSRELDEFEASMCWSVALRPAIAGTHLIAVTEGTPPCVDKEFRKLVIRCENWARIASGTGSKLVRRGWRCSAGNGTVKAGKELRHG